jgi:uncharacterized protein (TIGR03382 family)
MIRPLAFVFLAAGAALVSPWGASFIGSAHALGACVDDGFTRAPSIRREPVPTNARFLVAGKGLDVASVRLVDGATEAVIASEVEPTGSADGSVWLTPSALLVAGSSVRVSANVGGGVFDVGANVDDTAPAAPSIELSGARSDACCAGVGAAILATGGADDDDTPPAALELTVRSAAGERKVFLGHAAGVRQELGAAGDCYANDVLAAAGEEASVVVRALDWAGNASEAVGPLAFTYTSTRGAGSDDAVDARSSASSCSSVGGASPFFGVVLLALLRRRRAR